MWLYSVATASRAVWRAPRGSEAELWIQDPLLEGTGALGAGFPIGANGIDFAAGRRLARLQGTRGFVVGSLAFGAGRDRHTLFVTNFAIFNTVDPDPGLVKLPVGPPGTPDEDDGNGDDRHDG